jgi:hypothetical protein
LRTLHDTKFCEIKFTKYETNYFAILHFEMSATIHVDIYFRELILLIQVDIESVDITKALT